MQTSQTHTLSTSTDKARQWYCTTQKGYAGPKHRAGPPSSQVSTSYRPRHKRPITSPAQASRSLWRTATTHQTVSGPRPPHGTIAAWQSHAPGRLSAGGSAHSPIEQDSFSWTYATTGTRASQPSSLSSTPLHMPGGRHIWPDARSDALLPEHTAPALGDPPARPVMACGRLTYCQPGMACGVRAPLRGASRVRT